MQRGARSSATAPAVAPRRPRGAHPRLTRGGEPAPRRAAERASKARALCAVFRAAVRGHRGGRRRVRRGAVTAPRGAHLGTTAGGCWGVLSDRTEIGQRGRCPFRSHGNRSAGAGRGSEACGLYHIIFHPSLSLRTGPERPTPSRITARHGAHRPAMGAVDRALRPRASPEPAFSPRAQPPEMGSPLPLTAAASAPAATPRRQRRPWSHFRSTCPRPSPLSPGPPAPRAGPRPPP